MLRRSKAELLGAAVVFVVSLLVFTWTLAPTVTLVDSGELIVAARFLGVAHPPGFPLYVMLAHLASLMPIGNVAVRINFVSAFFAALACAMLTLVVAEIIITASHITHPEGNSRKSARRDKRKSSHSVATGDDTLGSLVTITAALSAGLLLAFSRTLWSYATIAEVYTLNTFLILTILFLMLRWRRRIVDARSTTAKPSSRGCEPFISKYDFLLYAAAVVFGFALGVHHVTVALILPGLAVLVYKTQGLKFFISKRLLYAALVSFAALVAVYSYLPLSAAHRPLLNWGDPHSLGAIWAHVTGKQYQLFLSFSPSIMRQQFLQFGRFLFSEFGPPLIPIALVTVVGGFIAVFRRDRTIFFLLLFVVLADLAYTLNYEIAEDKDAYYLPVFLATAIAAGVGWHSFLQSALAKRSPRVGRVFFVLAAIVVPALALTSNWPFNNRSHYFIAHDYIENIQSTIEPNGLLLTLDWQVASPMLYTREIEQRRRDIKVVDAQLLRRSWYFDYLRRAYPDFIERSRDKVDTYVAELKHWDQDPEAYQKSTVLNERIANAFQQMLESFVTRELDAGPVYVTAELILLKEGRDIEFMTWLRKNFQAVPQGLVFQLVRDNEFHDPKDPSLQIRGLNDGTIRFADDDVVKLKVLPFYRAMLESRGQYLAHFNQKERAAAASAEARKFENRQ